MDFAGWETDVLAQIGAPDTQTNVQFLGTWHNFELSACANNPLNTTLAVASSTKCNSAGVRSYTSAAMGAQATAATLTNGRYPALVAALQTGDPYSYTDPDGVAANIRTWGTPNFASAYLVSAGSFQGVGGTPPPPIVGSSGAGIAPSAHRGYADLRNSVQRHVPTQLQRSAHLGVLTLRILRDKTSVKGR